LIAAEGLSVQVGVELGTPQLRGPKKWTYYYRYVLLDIYSRYAVG
jgi:hypothetical protein